MQPVDFLAFCQWVQWCQDITVTIWKQTTPPPFSGVTEMSHDGTVLTWESKTSKTIGPQGPGRRCESWTQASWL